MNSRGLTIRAPRKSVIMAPTRKKITESQEAVVRAVLSGADKGSLYKEMSKQVTGTVVPGSRGKAMPAAATQPRKKKRKDKLPDQHVSQKRLTQPTSEQLNLRLTSYFKQLSDPWTYQGIKCPVNYNPVPSFMTCPARTTVTLTAQAITAMSQREIYLFPGHGHADATTPMDGESYHCWNQNIAGTQYAIGPVAAGGFNPVIGYMAPVVSYAAPMPDSTNSSLAGHTPLRYDVALPYTAVLGNGNHTRWKLLSMGIEIENVTPISQRGGQVIHVQPSIQVANTGNLLNDFANQPTFRISDKANDGPYKISWIPRAEDLAFWHAATVAPATAPTTPGMVIFLQAATTFDQQYTIQIVCNWELSGHSLAAVSSATIHQPADKNLVEPVVSALNFTKDSAKGALEVAKVVAQHAGPWAAKAGRVAGAAGQIAQLFLGG